MKNNKITASISAILITLLLASGCTSSPNDTDSTKTDITEADTVTADNANTDNETEESKVDNSDIISLAVKSDNKVCAFTENGTEIELLDVAEYNGGVQYTYCDGKLYLYLCKYTEGEGKNYNALGYINIAEGDYKFTKLAEVDTEGYPNSIAVANNTLYFTSSDFDGIYKYSIGTDEFSVFDDFDFRRQKGIKLYTVSDNKLAYSTAGTSEESPTVGIVDAEASTVKEIYSNASIGYIFNEKIICTVYGDNYSRWTYTEYNVNDDTAVQISDTTSSNTSISTSCIVPVDDYYVYVNTNSLYKYSNGKSEKLYEFETSVNNINLISKNVLSVAYGDDIQDEEKYGHFSLDKSEFSEIQNEVFYTQALYIK